MKKRRIFIIGLIVLLLACPSCMIYITVKQQDGYKKRVADNTNEYMLQFLTMAVESKTDPDYKPLNFNGLDEKSQEAATATMNEIFKTVLDMEQDDDGFHYEAYNEKTRQYYKNQKSYYPVAYEEFFKSSARSKYFYTDTVALFDESDIISNLDAGYNLEEGKDGKRSLLKVYNTYVDLNQVSINLPKDIEMTYYCTMYESPMTYIERNFVDEYDIAVLSGVALLLGLVIFIYILMNSLEVEEVINPYRTIKQWKLLTVIIIIGLTSFIFIGASGVTGTLVMTGELQGTLARHIFIEIARSHARERAHRLALGARGNDDEFPVKKVFALFDIDEHSFGDFEFADLHRRVHDLEHTAPRKGDFTAILHRQIDNLLQTVYIGRKRGDHKPTIHIFREKMIERSADDRFAHGIAEAFDICGFAHI